MAPVQPATAPPGRYGPASSGSSGSKRRGPLTLGIVLGILLLAFLGWAGYHFVGQADVSGRLVSYKVVSTHAVHAKLEVHKDADETVTCTVRSVTETGKEVGRKSVRLTQDSESARVSLRTTERATNAELVSCASR